MRGVVVAQQTLRMMLAPCKLRAAKQSMEESLVQHIEDLFEVVITPLGTAVALGPARMADLLRLARHGFAILKTLVAMVVRAVDGLFVNLGDQDMRDGMEDRLRRAFQQVRKADMQLAFAQPDGGIEGNE